MKTGTDESFAASVAARSGRPVAHAELLCGHPEQARDIVRTVRTRAYPRWHRIEHDDPYGYLSYGPERPGREHPRPVVGAGAGQGKRLRTRRRLLGAGGALVVAGVAALLQFGGSPRTVPAAPRPSTAATTDVVAIDRLFEITAEQAMVPGEFTRDVTYLGFPAETRFQARCELLRRTPDSRALPGGHVIPGKVTSWALRDGVKVIAAQQPSDEGTARYFEWTYKDSRYFLTCDPYDRGSDTPTALPHGPSDNELFALLEWINEHS